MENKNQAKIESVVKQYFDGEITATELMNWMVTVLEKHDYEGLKTWFETEILK